MQIDHSLILKLERLAKLNLSAPEREELKAELNNILGMIEKLQEIDTSQVEPLIYVNEEANAWREDEVKNQVNREAALSNAPAKDDRFFKAPKILNLK